MNKIDKILILGASGMLGSAIHRHLKNGYIDLLTPSSKDLDLLNPAIVNSYFNFHKPHKVFFAAALVGGIQANIDSPASFGYKNMQMCLNVFEAAKNNKVEKLLYLGSSCIYPKSCPQPMKEEHLLTGPFEPTNEMYAFSKAFGIKLAIAYNKEFGTNFFSCQPPNLYGINDNFDPITGHIVASLIRKFHDAKMNKLPSVTCWGTGNARRELMYVDDAADACVFLMKNYQNKEQFINAGCSTDHYIKEIVTVIKNIVMYEGKILWDESKPEGMKQKLMDSSRIRELGWKPVYNLATGVYKTYQWALEKGVL